MNTIRPYRPADREALWDLKRQFERSLAGEDGEKAAAYREKLDDDYRAAYLEWVQQCVAETDRALQVAVDEEGLAGYVFVLPESLAYVWDAAVLNELFVRESARGTGVADDLMEAALSLARDQDLPLDRLVLDVDPGNPRARSFYERWGFEAWAEMVARQL